MKTTTLKLGTFSNQSLLNDYNISINENFTNIEANALTPDELLLIQTANAPSLENPFATIDDLPTVELPTQIGSDADKFLQADGIGGVSYQTAGGGLGYLVYSAKLTHAAGSSAAPIVTILQNTTGLTLTWTRPFDGFWRTNVQVLDTSKLWINPLGHINYSTGTTATCKIDFSSGSEFQVMGIPDFANGNAANVYIEIRIYP